MKLLVVIGTVNFNGGAHVATWEMIDSLVGFNLVRLMKGLKKRWLKRLFLCLRTEADNIVDAVNGRLRWLGDVRCQATVVLCRPVFAADWHFA